MMADYSVRGLKGTTDYYEEGWKVSVYYQKMMDKEMMENSKKIEMSQWISTITHKCSL